MTGGKPRGVLNRRSLSVGGGKKEIKHKETKMFPGEKPSSNFLLRKKGTEQRGGKKPSSYLTPERGIHPSSPKRKGKSSSFFIFSLV